MIDLKNFFLYLGSIHFLKFWLHDFKYLKSFIHCVFLDRECQLTWGFIPDSGLYYHYQRTDYERPMKAKNQTEIYSEKRLNQ